MLATILMIAIFAVIVITDVVFALDAEEGNTYSELLRTAGYRWPVLPLGGGVVLSHWFLNFDTPRPPGGLGVLLALGFILTLADALSDHAISQVTHPGQWALLGLPLGSYLWSLDSVPRVLVG